MIHLFSFQSLSQYLGIFKITDFFEILCFVFLFSSMLAWLSKSKTKSTVRYFHLYCLCFLGSYFFGLQTLNVFLIFFTPVFFTLFLIFHQKMLQKNFVGTLAKKIPKPSIGQWFPILIRHCLYTINKNKQIRCIIEQNDSLETLLKKEMATNTPIDKNTLALMTENTFFDQHKMLWLSSDGTIKAFNSSWNIPLEDFSERLEEEEIWIESARLFTEQTDALIFSITPEKRSFDVFFEGKYIPNIPAHLFMKFKNFYGIASEKLIKKDIKYDAHNLSQQKQPPQ